MNIQTPKCNWYKILRRERLNSIKSCIVDIFGDFWWGNLGD